jgi:hypothetical protein
MTAGHLPVPATASGVAEQILAPLPAGRWSSIRARTDVGSHRLAPPSYIVGDAYVAADPKIHGHDRSDPGSLAAVTHDSVAVVLCSAGADRPRGWAQ